MAIERSLSIIVPGGVPGDPAGKARAASRTGGVRAPLRPAGAVPRPGAVERIPPSG